MRHRLALVKVIFGGLDLAGARGDYMRRQNCLKNAAPNVGNSLSADIWSGSVAKESLHDAISTAILKQAILKPEEVPVRCHIYSSLYTLPKALLKDVI